MGLAEALREVVRWWWFHGRHRRRRVALLASFPALLGPRVHQQIRALDGGPLRHGSCALASWRRYALGSALPLGCPPACVPCPRAVLRARSIFEGLAVLAEAASCGDRLLRACMRLLAPLVLQESRALGCASWACAAASTFRCHSSTGAGPWVPGGWTPGHFDFRCGYFISRKSTQAARGSPSTALAVAR